MAAEAIAADAAALRLGAQAEGDQAEEDEEEKEDSEELEDSSEDEAPVAPAAPPPVIAKLYGIPRDYKRPVEISVDIEGNKVSCKAIGPDYGENSASKFIHACKKDNSYFSVPYDGRKVLEIDCDSGVVQETGKTFRKEGGKYTEAVCSTNSRACMYAAPCRAQRMLEIDKETVPPTIKEVGPVLGSKKMNKWWAIAASCGGRIYAIPYDAPRVLEIDPNRGATAKMVGPDLGSVKGKYCCIAEAPNGNLYCAPLNAKQVLEIDPQGRVRLVGPDLGDTERKYTCIVQAQNKLLYAPPLYADRVLEINCARGDVREIGEVLGVGEAKYACAALSPLNGKIYCAPLEARKVLEIDPDRHESHQIGLDLGGQDVEKYSAICAGPDPCLKMYAAPRNAHCFLEICPRRAYVREVGSDHGRVDRKFSCIVPGNIWQGGMLKVDYDVIQAKKDLDYQHKIDKWERRTSSHQEAMMKDAFMSGRKMSSVTSRSGSKVDGIGLWSHSQSRSGSKVDTSESRSTSKVEPIETIDERRPSKLSMFNRK